MKDAGIADEYGLIVSFPDQSETFVLGFEAGQCFEKLARGERDNITMHAKNHEVFLRIARHYGLSVEFLPAVGVEMEWSVAVFTKAARAPLHVVKP